MAIFYHVFCVVVLVFVMGCRPPADIRAAEAKATDLVANRVLTNAVIDAFGAAPIRIYKRADALRYLEQSPSSQQWKSMSQYPTAYESSMARRGGWVLIYFDDEGRAASYYINIQ